jgi:hypothetical protein
VIYGSDINGEKSNVEDRIEYENGENVAIRGWPNKFLNRLTS